jgi:hypothetical protein
MRMLLAIRVPLARCDLFLDILRNRDCLLRELLGKPRGRDHNEQANDS